MTSYGIAIVRHNNILSRYELLLVMRRTSYAFLDFVRGSYSKSNVMELFKNMTFHERALVSTMNFHQLWYWAHFSNPPVMGFKAGYDRYNTQYAKFRAMWSGCPDRLRSMLSECRTNKNLWEIPKGRANPREEPMVTAMRETLEETGITSRSYRTLDIDPYTVKFSDRGKDYQYVFYIAAPTASFRMPSVDYRNKSQIREVVGMRWVSMDDVRKMQDHRLRGMVISIIKLAKKRYPGAGSSLAASMIGEWETHRLNTPPLMHSV